MSFVADLRDHDNVKGDTEELERWKHRCSRGRQYIVDRIRLEFGADKLYE